MYKKTGNFFVQKIINILQKIFEKSVDKGRKKVYNTK